MTEPLALPAYLRNLDAQTSLCRLSIPAIASSHWMSPNGFSPFISIMSFAHLWWLVPCFLS